MADYNYWSIKVEDSIFWLYIDNPTNKNAFDIPVVKELEYILDNEINSDIRVLIFTTALDDIFTVGLDIKWLVTLEDSKAKEMTTFLQKIFAKIENFPIPVIVAVKGINFTAGFELMLCADIVIAADNAKFGQVETKWGMVPAAGSTQRLTRLVGPMRAKELIYTSRIITASEAFNIGLISELVPLTELETRVKEIANEIIKCSGEAITLTKQLIQMGIYKNEEGFQREIEVFQERFSSGEPKRKLKEFIKNSK